MEPINVTIAEHFHANMRHKALQNLIVGLLIIVFFLFGLSVYLSFSIDKKKRQAATYKPINKGNSFVNKVYVSTVV